MISNLFDIFRNPRGSAFPATGKGKVDARTADRTCETGPSPNPPPTPGRRPDPNAGWGARPRRGGGRLKESGGSGTDANFLAGVLMTALFLVVVYITLVTIAEYQPHYSRLIHAKYLKVDHAYFEPVDAVVALTLNDQQPGGT